MAKFIKCEIIRFNMEQNNRDGTANFLVPHKLREDIEIILRFCEMEQKSVEDFILESVRRRVEEMKGCMYEALKE